MTDFNNSIGHGKINKVSGLNFEGTQGTPATPQNYEQKEINNLDNAHSALVGRSMVKKMKKAAAPEFNPELVAGVKESLASFKGNERIVGLSDKIFEAALAQGKSYEEAAKIEAEAVKYFKN